MDLNSILSAATATPTFSAVICPQHNQHILDEHNQSHDPEDERCHAEHIFLCRM
jgi:hypothetical protein